MVIAWHCYCLHLNFSPSKISFANNNNAHYTHVSCADELNGGHFYMIYTVEQETTVNKHNKNVEEILKSYSYCGFNVHAYAWSIHAYFVNILRTISWKMLNVPWIICGCVDHASWIFSKSTWPSISLLSIKNSVPWSIHVNFVNIIWI